MNEPKYRQMKMKKNWFAAAVTLTAAVAMQAEDIPVRSFRYTGPFVVQLPLLVDTVDVNRKTFDAANLLETPLAMPKPGTGVLYTDSVAPRSEAEYALHMLHFQLTSMGYAKVRLSVDGVKHYQLFVDGVKSDGNLTLLPATCQIVVKCLSHRGDNDSLRVRLDSDTPQLLAVATEGKRLYSLADAMNTAGYGGLDVTDNGRFLIDSRYETVNAKTTNWTYRITDLKTGRTVLETDRNLRWIPGTESYWTTRQGTKGRQLIATDAATGWQTVLTENLPEGSLTFSPTGDFIILEKSIKGPKDDKDVHQYVTPNDRQPGWRDRTVLARYDFDTGLERQLTFGYRPQSLLDISRDGRYILFSVYDDSFTQRPTGRTTVCRLDLQSMKTDTLMLNEGFFSSARFSPDGNRLVVVASPEAFGGIGKNVPEGRTPSMFDYQLYTIDCQTREVRPLTKHFNPSVEKVMWCAYDNMIYFSALDRDFCHFYRVDDKSGRIEQLPMQEEYLGRFSVAAGAPLAVWSGYGACNLSRLYRMDTRNRKSVMMEDLHEPHVADVELATCEDWNFVSQRGDTIYGRFYLPPRFDWSKQYPMLVYYYGGCSPMGRSMGSYYSYHQWASMGYVVYVVQPSGAAGFGQEFASRHVNTAGEGPAQDIIEGVERFCAAHPFVNTRKIGCLGASYGGFMTQYLQTKTDIFAAAVSHAGISDHTSYWGEGYWGFSYSETSMANSYPWSDRQLYVDRSPLYNADKIHTPLLFLHGTADTNVPVGESIQMYTALKLLGRPTAFVVVEGENHHIIDYEKRVKWINTMMAWFEKWLKDDSSWWDSMYDKIPQ